MIAWLIEYVPVEGDNAKQPMWWTGSHWNGHDDVAWTPDANNAIKFVSQIDASVVSMALMGYTGIEDRKIGRHRRRDWYGEFRPTEHEFLDVASSAGSAGQAVETIRDPDSGKMAARTATLSVDAAKAALFPAQPVDQQARRHANTLLNCLAGFDANPHPGSKADLARQWLRALAHPETQEPT